MIPRPHAVITLAAAPPSNLGAPPAARSCCFVMATIGVATTTLHNMESPYRGIGHSFDKEGPVALAVSLAMTDDQLKGAPPALDPGTSLGDHP